MDNFFKGFQGPLATLRVNITCVSRLHVRTELLCTGYQTCHLTVQTSLVLVTTLLVCKVNTIIWLLTTAILGALEMSITHSLGQFKRLLKTYLFGGWDRGAL